MSRHSNGAKDRDTEATLRALRRAARRARELGTSTGTPVYVIRDHRIVDLTKQDLAVNGKAIESRAARRRPN